MNVDALYLVEEDVGRSQRLAIGYAALVPYPLIWWAEAAEKPDGHPKYREVSALGLVNQWLDEIG